MRTLYLAGPMTGLPNFNFPAFHAAAKALRKEGWTVLSPAETDDGNAIRPREYYMAINFRHLLDTAAIALLDGWEKSAGASLEFAVARAAGKSTYAFRMDGKRPLLIPIKGTPTVVLWHNIVICRGVEPEAAK